MAKTNPFEILQKKELSDEELKEHIELKAKVSSNISMHLHLDLYCY